MLLVWNGSVEGPFWRNHPAAPLAWVVVLVAYLTMPLVPLAWLRIVVRAGSERAQVAGYALAGMIVWPFQVMALLPYVQ